MVHEESFCPTLLPTRKGNIPEGCYLFSRRSHTATARRASVDQEVCVTMRLTCPIMAIDQAGDVGLGLAAHQVGRTEFLQHAVVVVFIDLSLVVDPEEAEGHKRSCFDHPAG